MAVYVDDMHKSPMGRFSRMKLSHMLADTEAELQAMADRIGVARKWYQGDHYDIAVSKRALAVEAGAIEITLRQAGAMSMLRKATGTMGDPATAFERVSALLDARRAERATSEVAR